MDTLLNNLVTIFGTNVDDVKALKCTSGSVELRHTFYHYAARNTMLTYSNIGGMFNQSHSIVHKAIKGVDDLLIIDERFKNKYEAAAVHLDEYFAKTFATKLNPKPIRYLMTQTDVSKLIGSNIFDPEYHFHQGIGMVVYDLVDKLYTKDGYTWSDIAIDTM